MLHLCKLLLLNCAYSYELPPVLSYNEEKIPLYHDSNGFAPIDVSTDKLSKEFDPYLHNIPRYVERLKLMFEAECQGERTFRGIHMPDWIIWGFPSIIQKRNSLTLYLGNKSGDAPVKIGRLDLKETGKTVADGVDLIRRFLDQYIDYDDIKITSYRAPLKKDAYSRHWTEIDDLILQMLIDSSKYKLTEIDQEETVRLIGEFFRWRRIVSDFCQLTFNQFDEVKLPQVFENFLINKQKLPLSEAKKYKYLLDIRRQHLGLILADPSQSVETVTEIFANFTLYGLTKDQSQADRYREDMFPQ